MRKSLSMLSLALLFLIALTGCSQNLYSEIKWTEVPEAVQEEIMDARLDAGAYAVAYDGVVYLEVSSGEENQLGEHLRFLNKAAYDQASQILTLYFEQYVPQTGNPGTEISSDDWFRILRFKKTNASQFKVVINDEEKYTVTVPK